MNMINMDSYPTVKSLALRSQWESDTMFCSVCSSSFTLVKRRHHCRVCGVCACGKCTSIRQVFVLDTKSLVRIRICISCINSAQNREKSIDSASNIDILYGDPSMNAKHLDLEENARSPGAVDSAVSDRWVENKTSGNLVAPLINECDVSSHADGVQFRKLNSSAHEDHDIVDDTATESFSHHQKTSFSYELSEDTIYSPYLSFDRQKSQTVDSLTLDRANSYHTHHSINDDATETEEKSTESITGLPTSQDSSNCTIVSSPPIEPASTTSASNRKVMSRRQFDANRKIALATTEWVSGLDKSNFDPSAVQLFQSFPPSTDKDFNFASSYSSSECEANPQDVGMSSSNLTVSRTNSNPVNNAESAISPVSYDMNRIAFSNNRNSSAVLSTSASSVFSSTSTWNSGSTMTPANAMDIDEPIDNIRHTSSEKEDHLSPATSAGHRLSNLSNSDYLGDALVPVRRTSLGIAASTITENVASTPAVSNPVYVHVVRRKKPWGKTRNGTTSALQPPASVFHNQSFFVPASATTNNESDSNNSYPESPITPAPALQLPQLLYRPSSTTAVSSLTSFPPSVSASPASSRPNSLQLATPITPSFRDLISIRGSVSSPFAHLLAHTPGTPHTPHTPVVPLPEHPPAVLTIATASLIRSLLAPDMTTNTPLPLASHLQTIPALSLDDSPTESPSPSATGGFNHSPSQPLTPCVDTPRALTSNSSFTSHAASASASTYGLHSQSTSTLSSASTVPESFSQTLQKHVDTHSTGLSFIPGPLHTKNVSVPVLTIPAAIQRRQSLDQAADLTANQTTAVDVDRYGNPPPAVTGAFDLAIAAATVTPLDSLLPDSLSVSDRQQWSFVAPGARRGIHSSASIGDIGSDCGSGSHLGADSFCIDTPWNPNWDTLFPSHFPSQSPSPSPALSPSPIPSTSTNASAPPHLLSTTAVTTASTEFTAPFVSLSLSIPISMTAAAANTATVPLYSSPTSTTASTTPTTLNFKVGQLGDMDDLLSTIYASEDTTPCSQHLPATTPSGIPAPSPEVQPLTPTSTSALEKNAREEEESMKAIVYMEAPKHVMASENDATCDSGDGVRKEMENEDSTTAAELDVDLETYPESSVEPSPELNKDSTRKAEVHRVLTPNMGALALKSVSSAYLAELASKATLSMPTPPYYSLSTPQMSITPTSLMTIPSVTASVSTASPASVHARSSNASVPTFDLSLSEVASIRASATSSAGKDPSARVEPPPAGLQPPQLPLLLALKPPTIASVPVATMSLTPPPLPPALAELSSITLPPFVPRLDSTQSRSNSASSNAGASSSSSSSSSASFFPNFSTSINTPSNEISSPLTQSSSFFTVESSAPAPAGTPPLPSFLQNLLPPMANLNLSTMPLPLPPLEAAAPTKTSPEQSVTQGITATLQAGSSKQEKRVPSMQSSASDKPTFVFKISKCKKKTKLAGEPETPTPKATPIATDAVATPTTSATESQFPPHPLRLSSTSSSTTLVSSNDPMDSPLPPLVIPKTPFAIEISSQHDLPLPPDPYDKHIFFDWLRGGGKIAYVFRELSPRLTSNVVCTTDGKLNSGPATPQLTPRTPLYSLPIQSMIVQCNAVQILDTAASASTLREHELMIYPDSVAEVQLHIFQKYSAYDLQQSQPYANLLLLLPSSFAPSITPRVSAPDSNASSKGNHYPPQEDTTHMWSGLSTTHSTHSSMRSSFPSDESSRERTSRDESCVSEHFQASYTPVPRLRLPGHSVDNNSFGGLASWTPSPTATSSPSPPPSFHSSSLLATQLLAPGQQLQPQSRDGPGQGRKQPPALPPLRIPLPRAPSFGGPASASSTLGASSGASSGSGFARPPTPGGNTATTTTTVASSTTASTTMPPPFLPRHTSPTCHLQLAFPQLFSSPHAQSLSHTPLAQGLTRALSQNSLPVPITPGTRSSSFCQSLCQSLNSSPRQGLPSNNSAMYPGVASYGFQAPPFPVPVPGSTAGARSALTTPVGSFCPLLSIPTHPHPHANSLTQPPTPNQYPYHQTHHRAADQPSPGSYGGTSFTGGHSCTCGGASSGGGGGGSGTSSLTGSHNDRAYHKLVWSARNRVARTSVYTDTSQHPSFCEGEEFSDDDPFEVFEPQPCLRCHGALGASGFDTATGSRSSRCGDRDFVAAGYYLPHRGDDYTVTSGSYASSTSGSTLAAAAVAAGRANSGGTSSTAGGGSDTALLATQLYSYLEADSPAGATAPANSFFRAPSLYQAFASPMSPMSPIDHTHGHSSHHTQNPYDRGRNTPMTLSIPSTPRSATPHTRTPQVRTPAAPSPRPSFSTAGSTSGGTGGDGTDPSKDLATHTCLNCAKTFSRAKWSRNGRATPRFQSPNGAASGVDGKGPTGATAGGVGRSGKDFFASMFSGTHDSEPPLCSKDCYTSFAVGMGQANLLRS